MGGQPHPAILAGRFFPSVEPDTNFELSNFESVTNFSSTLHARELRFPSGMSSDGKPEMDGSYMVEGR